MHTRAAIDPEDAAASCKPLAKDRSGLVLGEDAAMLVLKTWERARARGALIDGELIGCGGVTDTGHLARPNPRAAETVWHTAAL